MIATELLILIAERGASINAAGDRLRVTGDNLLDDGLRNAIVEMKPELLALLQSSVTAVPDPATVRSTQPMACSAVPSGLTSRAFYPAQAYRPDPYFTRAELDELTEAQRAYRVLLAEVVRNGASAAQRAAIFNQGEAEAIEAAREYSEYFEPEHSE